MIRAERRTRPGGNGRTGKRRRLLRRVLLVALALLIAYIGWLDYRITSQFRDRGFTVPTQVHARALELHPGLRLPGKELVQELARLGYRESGAGKPGGYARDGARFDIHLRRATFPDRTREATRIQAVADARGVRAVKDGNGRELRSLALEPALLGNLHPVHGEDRIMVPPEQVPALLPAALMVIEDRNYQTHAGVDLKAILRAAWVNLRAGRVEQGGSTLTQQLVKSYFLDQRRSLARKAREAAMAVLLELHFSKTELMNGYINEIYLGQDGDRAIHGFGLASRFYFGRPLEELELADIALLVGIVRGPSYYNPRTQPERATARRNFVLSELVELEVVTAEDGAAAAKKPLDVVPRTRRRTYPAYLEYVRRELRQDYDDEDLNLAGLRVFTSLDPRTQAAAERAVAEELPKLDVRRRSNKQPLETALVVTLPDSGEVVALVGGRQPQAAGFNRALNAKRPIGSLVKPIVYLAALETGRYHLASPLNDGPVEVRMRNGQSWRPQNIDREMLGPMPFVRALADSRNLATVRLGLEIGLAPVAEGFRALGHDRLPDQVPSLLLGAVDLSPIEVAQVYNAFANGGTHVPLSAVQSVITADGKRLPAKPREARRAASPVAIYQLDRMLAEVMIRGTGRAGSARLPAGLVTAGKTGTSSDLRDSWFAGFSGSHLVVAWVGHDDNSPAGLTGSQGALPLWANVMGAIARRSWQAPLPASLEEVTIDYATGLVPPDPACAHELVSVPVPRGTALEYTSDCYPLEFDGFVERVRDWWQRLTD